MRSASTGHVVPKTCKSWLCETCNPWLRDAAKRWLYNGARKPPGENLTLTFLTLTDGARAELDMPGFGAAWNRTRGSLERSFGMAAYALSVELQDRMALHGHALAWVPEEWAQKHLPEHKQEKRDRAQWRFHFNELVPLVKEQGWGRMVDWRRVVEGQEDVAAEYAAKSLSRYATKQAYAAFKNAGAHRVRPIRGSRTWNEGRGLGHYQQGEKATDPGPWVDVTSVCGRI